MHLPKKKSFMRNAKYSYEYNTVVWKYMTSSNLNFILLSSCFLILEESLELTVRWNLIYLKVTFLNIKLTIDIWKIQKNIQIKIKIMHNPQKRITFNIKAYFLIKRVIYHLPHYTSPISLKKSSLSFIIHSIS